MNKSEMYFESSKKLIPGGVNSPVRAFKSVGGTPPFINKGKGKWIYDIDNNKYIDFLSSWGPLILGHREKNVYKSVKKSLKKGFSFGAPTREEVELAELVVNSVPSIEKVRFVNSGTEAVMSALRLARAYTGKNKIIKFDGCYHGHSDSMLVSAGSGMVSIPSSKGVPINFLKDTISIPFNSKEEVEKVFSENRDIAAVIVEPVPGNMGVVLPENGYLSFLRDITTRNGALLIFDEVITGFRLSLGGAQELFKIKPDITTLGKIIGGGFPVGAYGGLKEIMNMVAPSGEMYQAGTLSGNPVAMSAGIATLKQLNKKNFYHNLNKTSEKFIEKLKESTKELPVTINSIGSMFTVFFNEKSVNNYITASTSDLKKFRQYFHKLLDKGIYISPSQFECCFISKAFIEKDLDYAHDIILKAINEVINENII